MLHGLTGGQARYARSELCPQRAFPLPAVCGAFCWIGGVSEISPFDCVWRRESGDADFEVVSKGCEGDSIVGVPAVAFVAVVVGFYCRRFDVDEGRAATDLLLFYWCCGESCADAW